MIQWKLTVKINYLGPVPPLSFRGSDNLNMTPLSDRGTKTEISITYFTYGFVVKFGGTGP